MISLSLSTISRRATDCTRPAESFGWIFLQSTGESSNPTRRSSTLLACWAFTRFMSISRGFSIALRMAGFVISWKTIRLVFSLLSPNVSKRCHEIASPSRSASDASQMADASFAAFFSSATTFFLSAGTTYSGLKPLAISMLNPLSSRSLICPMLAFTI